MTDTDDVAAAQMFLQRRLEMIWSAALWRDSLLEATLTANPDGTTSLADSYWIPGRSVLLLPAAIEKIIAARLNTNTLEVASLESYYRADTDWLDYQGTPFEFQLLKPVVMEWASAQALSLSDPNGAEANIACNFSYSPDGVTITAGTGATNAQMGTALQLFSFSKPPTSGVVTITASAPVTVAGMTYTGSPQATATVPVTQGQTYKIVPGANENGTVLVNGTQTTVLQTGTAVTVIAQGTQLLFEYPDLIPAGTVYNSAAGSFGTAYYQQVLSVGTTYNFVWGANEQSGVLGANPGFIINPGVGTVDQFTAQPSPSNLLDCFQLTTQGGAVVTGQLYLAASNLAFTATVTQIFTSINVAATCNNAPMHQRIRLTEAPQVSVNLRVLGKGKCPILGAYDTAPITNVEPALMAFARGDLLLRQRQFGKASLAQQEGTALLKELTENEAFQQAGEFRIQPDAGFGSDIWWQTGPDSYHPL
jgi:hypothetical protein